MVAEARLSLDQISFLSQFYAGHFNQFDSIIDCADGAGQVMAHARGDKGCYIKIFCHMMGLKKEGPWKT